MNVDYYDTRSPSIQVRSVNSGDSSVIITSLLGNEPGHEEALGIWEPIIAGRDVAVMSLYENPPIPPLAKNGQEECLRHESFSMATAQALYSAVWVIGS